MVKEKNLAEKVPCFTKKTGFTLIELLVVLAIVALLLTLSAPRYFQSVDKTKDVVLVENLRITRDAIDKFYGDVGRYPNTLQELVDRKYLRALPVDPIAQTPWVIVAPDNSSLGLVFDIKSSAPGKTKDGKIYSEL